MRHLTLRQITYIGDMFLDKCFRDSLYERQTKGPMSSGDQTNRLKQTVMVLLYLSAFWKAHVLYM